MTHRSPQQPPIDWRRSAWLAARRGRSERERACHQAALEILEDFNATGRPFALFLRAFRIRQLYCHASDGGDGGDGILLEVHLQRVLQRFGANIIRVQDTEGGVESALPNETPGLLLAHDSWLEAVKALLARAELIVSECQFLTPGVLAELKACENSGKIDQTVLVLPSAPFEFIGNDPALIHFPRAIQQLDLDPACPARSAVFADLIERMAKIAAMHSGERVPLIRENRLRSAVPVTYHEVPEGLWQRACHYANQQSVGGAYFLGSKAVLAAKAGQGVLTSIEVQLSLAALCGEAGNPTLCLDLIDEVDPTIHEQSLELDGAERARLLEMVARGRDEMLGRLFESLMRPERADELWQLANTQGAFALKRQDRRTLAQCLAWMAAAALLAGKVDLAIDQANGAIALAQQIADTYRESFASFYLGNAYRALGDPDAASAAFSRAVALCPPDRRGGFLAAALLSLAEVQCQLGEREQALQNYRSAQEVAAQQGQAGFEKTAAERIARLSIDEGKGDPATGRP